MAVESEFDKRIAGLERLESLFGPDLNLSNAEIVSINLDRQGPAITVIIFAPFIRNYTEPWTLTFLFEDVEDVRIENFNHQNVLMGFILKPQEDRISASF